MLYKLSISIPSILFGGFIVYIFIKMEHEKKFEKNKKELDKLKYEIKNKDESLQRLTSEILYCEKQLHKYKIKEDNGRTLSSNELFYKIPETNAYNFLRKKAKEFKTTPIKILPQLFTAYHYANTEEKISEDYEHFLNRHRDRQAKHKVFNLKMTAPEAEKFDPVEFGSYSIVIVDENGEATGKAMSIFMS